MERPITHFDWVGILDRLDIPPVVCSNVGESVLALQKFVLRYFYQAWVVDYTKSVSSTSVSSDNDLEMKDMTGINPDIDTPEEKNDAMEFDLSSDVEMKSPSDTELQVEEIPVNNSLELSLTEIGLNF